MRSGSRFGVVPQDFANLVRQRIAREWLLQEETLPQEFSLPLLYSRDLSGWRDLAFDLREGVLSQIFPGTPGEFAEPRVD